MHGHGFEVILHANQDLGKRDLSTGATEGRALDLLRDGGLQLEEVERLAEVVHQPAEELMQANLLEGIDVLNRNLEHLFGTVLHGAQKRVAESLGVDTTTVSRWAAGKLAPNQTNLTRIARFFGIPGDIDLKSEPIFLSLDPPSVTEKREWLVKAVQSLGEREVVEYYPALRKLLK